MALITRLSRLFEADFHAVLDRIEEPDLQLKQAVREMQFALEQDRQRLKLLQHEADEIARGSDDALASLRAYDEELDICLAAKKDDLARDLVRRKLAAERQLQALEKQSGKVDQLRQALGAQIEEQSQQLVGMQQKLELLVREDSPLGTDSGPVDGIRSEEIEIGLLREKQRRAKP